ncbi:uncharacterized protein LOC122253799 [Penaeus japonicus]|uniref:uncharacterized protein LOC122253799 n=1 Tax=Penaeus japonicus TaxID=27405 RepID=UPI001C70F402|nr:uncharacterized protein LOC122253799 [Penaeus japonicus]
MAPQENNTEAPREWRGWGHWLKQEFTIDKRFIPIKCIIFFFTGGVVAFIPYLTLHMQQLGLNVEEIAIMYAVLPLASLLGPPATGMIADKFGKYNIMFIINIILTGVFHTLMLQVPPVPTNTLSFQCDSGGHRLVWGECDDCYDLRNNTQAALDIRFCKYDCDAPLEDLQMCLSNVNTTTCTSFNSTDKYRASVACRQRTRGATECRRVHARSCLRESFLGFRSWPSCDHVSLKYEISLSLHFAIHINGSLQVPGMEEGQPCFHSWREMQFEGNLYSNLTCNSACPMTCKVFGEKTCHEMLAKSAPPLTFWTYFVLRLIATFFLGSSFTMMDAVTLAQINKQGGEFGKQRSHDDGWFFHHSPHRRHHHRQDQGGPQRNISFCQRFMSTHCRHAFFIFFSPGIIDYMPAFYLGDALLLLSVVLVSRLPLEVEMPEESLTKGLKEIITRVEIDIFMILILIMGTNYGYIESYLFVYLKELKAPNYLLGLTMTTGCMISIPMLFWADPIVAKMGRHNVFLVSFLAYAVRMFGYAYITNPWMCFPFETLEVFTYQLMWVAAATYCPILAPKGLLATMTGMAGAMHYSFGKGLGAFAGGYLIAHLSTAGAFKVFGGVALFGAVFYFFIHHCYMKKLVAKREKEYEITKEEEDSKVAELEVMQGKDRRVSRVSTYSRKSSVDQSGRRLSVVDVLM